MTITCLSPQPPSPAASSTRSGRHIPLLSLAPPALALGAGLTVGEPGEEHNVGEIWNVITRAADLVKDGERLENLAWRHWGQPARIPTHRRSSISSAGSCSTTSLHTPLTEHSSYGLSRSRSFERRTFGGALSLLLEEDSNFKDWVTDAKQRLPIPVLSVPDTPVANVEIRLVEPTPVPSRVGSLGGSLATSGLLSATAVPPKLNEEDEIEEISSEEEEGLEIKPSSRSNARAARKRGRFFLHQSPTKGSGSDTSNPPPSADLSDKPASPTIVETHVEKGASLSPSTRRPHHSPRSARKSSGSSGHGDSTGKSKRARIRDLIEADKPPRRNVSLSTMRGRFTAEKRKAAEAIAAKEEDSGWEDEVEDWEDAGEDKVDEAAVVTEEPAPIEAAQEESASEEEEDAAVGDEEDWSDEPDSPDKPKRRSSSTVSKPDLDITHLLTRRKSNPKPSPPPPAPTPIHRMSKKDRLAAAAERAMIEAELEAQRKREMFAKQQIFGKSHGSSSGLSGLFRTGRSMVDLTQAPEYADANAIRPSPTHGHLPSLGHSHAAAPNILRSKSAVAMPVQTGVSVTISPNGASNSSTQSQAGPVASRVGSHLSDKKRSDSKSSKGSQERGPPAGVELESSDEDSEAEDDYLATSTTQRKLAELVAKKDAKVQPVAAPAVRFDATGVMQPISPTTRRRTIIMREMSESLRRNLILEREKSSGGNTRTTSAQSSRPAPQKQYTAPSPLSRNGSQTNLVTNPPLARHQSDSKLDAGRQPSPPRRPHPSVLGAGFLRPLTRVGNTNEQILNRTQSSANLSGSSSPTGHSPGGVLPEATAMQRSSTEGEGNAAVRRQMSRRNPVLDSGYRAHGW